MDNGKSKTIIFGASGAGRAAYERMKDTHSVVAFYDNDRSKVGTTVFGIPVLAPTVPLAEGAGKVVVAGSYAKEMFEQLTGELGLEADRIECSGVEGSVFGWLARNKRLRMDPQFDIWDKSRRDFHVERYRFARDYVRGKQTLDAACGTGYGSEILAEVARSVDGVEMDAEAVAYARERHGGERTVFHRHFAEYMPFEENSYDAIVSFETIEHLYCPEALMREFSRLLRPDGVLVLSAPHRWGLTPNHFVDFDYAMLKDLVEAHFGECSYFYNNSGVRRGRGPKGTGPLDVARVDEAECIIAVATRPRKSVCTPREHMEKTLKEIYDRVSVRHKEYVAALFKDN